MLSMLGKNFGRRPKYFLFFQKYRLQIVSAGDNLHEISKPIFYPQETVFMKCQSLFSGDALHELSKLTFCPQETIFMKCQSLFSGKNKKNIVFFVIC